MSQFISDFLSLSTVSIAMGAALLGDLDPVSRDAPDTAGPEEILVASAATTSDLMRAAASRNVAPAPYSDIPEAELLTVSFLSSKQAVALPVQKSAAGDTLMGEVKGQSVNLRAGPGTNFPVMSRAIGGQKFAVTGATEGVWVEIVDPEVDTPVWIHGNYFRAPQAAG